LNYAIEGGDYADLIGLLAAGAQLTVRHAIKTANLALLKALVTGMADLSRDDYLKLLGVEEKMFTIQESKPPTFDPATKKQEPLTWTSVKEMKSIQCLHINRDLNLEPCSLWLQRPGRCSRKSLLLSQTRLTALWNQASDERSDWSMRFPADGGEVIDEAVSRSPACSLLLPRGQRLSYHHQHGTAAGGQALLQVGQL
jgi:hypothetical protein